MSYITKITRRELTSLKKKAATLGDRVAFATGNSPSHDVRREGARLAEVLEEWLDDLEELFQSGDESLLERARSFATRLTLADEKVTAWGVPAEVPVEAQKKKKKKAA